MAIVTTPLTNRFTLKLNKGTSESGTILTQSQAFTGLKKTEWTSQDDEAAYAIGNLMRRVLTYPVYRYERAATVTVEAE